MDTEVNCLAVGELRDLKDNEIYYAYLVVGRN